MDSRATFELFTWQEDTRTPEESTTIFARQGPESAILPRSFVLSLFGILALLHFGTLAQVRASAAGGTRTYVPLIGGRKGSNPPETCMLRMLENIGAEKLCVGIRARFHEAARQKRAIFERIASRTRERSDSRDREAEEKECISRQRGRKRVIPRSWDA